MFNNLDLEKNNPVSNSSKLQHIANKVTAVKTELNKVIVGQDSAIDLILAALFTGGHVLLEGPPGIAKTLLAKSFTKTLNTGFSRVQFTPDLMPSDIVGTSIFDLKTTEFVFKKGPVFSNIILIDEINRSPAKTQAALFELMEEKQITVDGKTYPMDFPYMVLATQNPIEQEGTYRLPEAQQDRFLFKLILTYPSITEELAILKKYQEDFSIKALHTIQAVFSPTEIKECIELTEKIHIKTELLEYIAVLVTKTRNHPDIFLGASTRASLAFMKASKAVAAMRGRDFVTPDDIQYVAYPVLNHRLILAPEREMEGVTTLDVIEGIIKSIEVPR